LHLAHSVALPPSLPHWHFTNNRWRMRMVNMMSGLTCLRSLATELRWRGLRRGCGGAPPRRECGHGRGGPRSSCHRGVAPSPATAATGDLASTAIAGAWELRPQPPPSRATSASGHRCGQPRPDHRREREHRELCHN
jgi:hypothetical protein